MIMTGRTVDAEEAARIGLVNRLIEGDAVAQGMAYAREFSGYSLPVLGFAREARSSAALDNPVAEGLNAHRSGNSVHPRVPDRRCGRRHGRVRGEAQTEFKDQMKRPAT